MINGLDIYYSKNIERGLKPISNKKSKWVWFKTN